jgi:hypothetical protein
MKIMIYSELEMLIRNDMLSVGLSPDNKDHVKLYWSTRL